MRTPFGLLVVIRKTESKLLSTGRKKFHHREASLHRRGRHRGRQHRRSQEDRLYLLGDWRTGKGFA